jgi:hypothetical protein
LSKNYRPNRAALKEMFALWQTGDFGLAGGQVGSQFPLVRSARLAAFCFASTAFGIGLLWLGSTRMAFAGAFLAGALGPLIMGAGFDRTGSYRGPLVAFVAATLLAATLLSRLGAYRYQPISHFAE